MTTDINAQMTEYLIAQFCDITNQNPADCAVEYFADDERTTISVRHHSNDDVREYYDCVSGSDDDAFVFIPRSCPEFIDAHITIEFPDADWFNEF